jgi:hypothetical protein
MKLFSFFKNVFSTKKSSTTLNDNQTQEIPPTSDDLEVQDLNPIEEITTEDFNSEVDDEFIEEVPFEDSSNEEPSLIEEEESWTPMEEVMDKLKSKYGSYDLTSFLDYDYEKDGRQDGYNIHTSEFLKKKKMYLICEFQRLIEKRVDELKDERLECKNLIIDMRGLSDQLVEKFQLRVDLCNEYIEDLHKEKSLSDGGLGLIRSVICDYECGWDKGMSDYLTDHYFINPLKRL